MTVKPRLQSYPLPPDELDDVEEELKIRRRSSEQFKISVQEFNSDNPAPIIGEVSVLYKLSGQLRTYQSGNGKHWITLFMNDLDSGIF